MTTLAPLDPAPHRLQITTPLPTIPTEPAASLTDRDRAVLRAVADGRCDYAGTSLTIDSVRCCDQFVGLRLAAAGLITGQDTVCLTAEGREFLTVR